MHPYQKHIPRFKHQSPPPFNTSKPTQKKNLLYPFPSYISIPGSTRQPRPPSSSPGDTPHLLDTCPVRSKKPQVPRPTKNKKRFTNRSEKISRLKTLGSSRKPAGKPITPSPKPPQNPSTLVSPRDQKIREASVGPLHRDRDSVPKLPPPKIALPTLHMARIPFKPSYPHPHPLPPTPRSRPSPPIAFSLTWYPQKRSRARTPGTRDVLRDDHPRKLSPPLKTCSAVIWTTTSKKRAFQTQRQRIPHSSPSSPILPVTAPFS